LGDLAEADRVVVEPHYKLAAPKNCPLAPDRWSLMLLSCRPLEWKPRQGADILGLRANIIRFRTCI
jgi:hypothetical protein